MNRRLAVMTAALVASGLVVPGVGATAAVKAKPAPKPVCLMLTDQRGDAKIQGQGNNYAVDDIVSADIATGKKTIVGVLRLASGDSASGIPTGATYVLRWTQTQKGSDGKTSTMQAAFFFYVYATGGTSGGFGTSTDPSFAPNDTTAVSSATMSSQGVITWVINRKDASVANGAKFGALSATSSISDNFQIGNGGVRGSAQTLDDATGHASYTDMQPSCVRAS
ncbi:MAG: hypothetical protein QOD07_418 [Frankiaceae bacterium]|jgi:hypothetical protein|nr:hypothetical protein [Frankiaceae bacterium]